MSDPKKEEQPKFAVNVNFDTTPIYYTENISITGSEDGIVIDFCQKLINTNQLRIVARVGMSRSHAKKFLKELNSSLALTEANLKTGEKN